MEQTCQEQRDEQETPGSLHGFTKGTSCLTNQAASNDGVTASLHNGKATHAVYAKDFCKACPAPVSLNWTDVASKGELFAG